VNQFEDKKMGAIFSPSIPSPPAQPKPPAPPPDINAMRKDLANQESLARKPKGRESNLLTGAFGDSTSTTPGTKTLLG
jgi:hypothetical protein